MEEADKPWAWVWNAKTNCTVCGDQINPFGVWYTHPILKTMQCGECNKFYHKGQWAPPYKLGLFFLSLAQIFKFILLGRLILRGATFV
jgi:hypothetical protein